MKEIFEIIKITLPSIIVFGVVYYMLNQFLKKEKEIRAQELKLIAKKDYFPVQMQAYERAILYLERIDPNNLIFRIHKRGMSGKLLHAELLRVIREEYAHNMSQQVYISNSGWSALKKSREETVQVINMAKSKINETSSAIELSTGIFEILSKMDKIPTDKAAEILKNEFQKGIL
jgi:hypothetical protein